MEFDGVPFVKVAERRFVCEHSRRPESKQLRTDEQTGEQPVSECDVNVCILQIVRFPQYRVSVAKLTNLESATTSLTCYFASTGSDRYESRQTVLLVVAAA